MKKRIVFVLVSLIALVMLAFAPVIQRQVFQEIVTRKLRVQAGGSEFQSNINITIPTVQATTTPGILINASGLGNAIEVRNASGTPTFYTDPDGNIVYTSSSGGAGAIADAVSITAPTAVGTATPALRANNLGVSKVFEFLDGGVVVMDGYNGGGVNIAAPTAIATGVPAVSVNNLGVSKPFEFKDGGAVVLDSYNGGGVNVVAPTAIATGVPGLSVTCTGNSECNRVVVKGTPAWAVEADGDIATENGYVLSYPSANTIQYCGTNTITATLAITSSTHGISTVSGGWCILAQDPTGDAQSCSTSKSGETITVKVWQSAATPTANATGASVFWCAVGTP